VTAKETIVTMAFEYPEPGSWPSPLKFRDKPKRFYNGTGVGYVRKEEWLTPRRVRLKRTTV
jgi:hypothetical protein